MYKGWEVDEDQSFDHLISITQCVISQPQQEQIIKISPKNAKIRFRTASMPKVEEAPVKEETIEKKEIPKLFQKQTQDKLVFPLKPRYRAKQIQPQSRISLRSTLFQNPIEFTTQNKFCRTVSQKFFNPLIRNGEQQLKLGLSRKMKSMSNIFNDERITYKKHDFTYLTQQRSNAVYVALSK